MARAGSSRVVETVLLPIREVEDLVVSTVKANRVTVVMAETGSGKTTQIPQVTSAE